MSACTAAPTPDQITRAKDRALIEIERWRNDHDLDRDDEDWRQHVFESKIAEIVAYDELARLGYDVEFVDDDDDTSHDLLVEGVVTVEVKLRRAKYYAPDLILRDWSPTADVFVMVEAEATPSWQQFNATKCASRSVVEDNMEPFRADRPLVPRAELADIGELPSLIGDALRAGDDDD